MVEEDFEQRMTALIDRLEKKVDSLEQRVFLLSEKKLPAARRLFGYTFWGGVLFILGALWLAYEEDWIDFRVELWPVALIALGLYLILAPRK
ncbi:MAG: hypothetical protein FJY66_05675 [Calditrichaeota bacterium]|nr:hypothetical protein [Calditrichota bacterium]